MKNTVGIIINSPNQSDLDDMVYHRSIHTIPIGGKYRLIDFSLSNLINSGINKIGVIGSYKYRSLVDHLGSGIDWSLSRKSNDLAILHGGRSSKIGEITKINLQDFVDNIAFLNKLSSQVENIVIYGSNIICNFDLKNTLDYHNENNADITMIYKKDYQDEISEYGVILEIEDNIITDLRYRGTHREDHLNVYMDMLIIKKELLSNIIKNVYESGDIDLIDVISNNIKKLKVIGYQLDSYVKIINTLKSYFECSMDLLKPSIQKELFYGGRRIFTKVKDNHPTKYSDESKVKNSLVASGAKIYGTVENSIIFREVTVGKGAKVKNCIIMQHGIIGEDTKIANAILDKYVTISKNRILEGTEEEPLIIKKNSLI